MIRRACILVGMAAAFGPLSGQTILWNSEANAINLTSDGQLMDAGFRFELGVFEGLFSPTEANLADWAVHWKRAKRASYDTSSQRFSSSFTPQDNDSPFAIDKQAYVWGFRGSATSGEWILFRASSWLFPDANPPVPPSANAYEWFAKNAKPVIGSINSGGSPFLMKSAVVTNASPPATDWGLWVTENLAGEPQNAPGQDPDHDGISNLMEFVFGTPPNLPGAPTPMPTSLVEVSGLKYQQISIPRRIDHPANLTVEVSSNLGDWYSGASFTQVVEETATTWVVRDLTPLDSAHPMRFMRLKAEIAQP